MRFAALALALAVSPAALHARQLPVYFTKGDGLGAVNRGGGTLSGALRTLLAGPSGAERARGLGTEIPPGTRLRGVVVKRGIAWIDLTPRFGTHGGYASLYFRVRQLVFTATSVKRVWAVRLLLGGKVVETLGGDGLVVDHALTRSEFGRT